MPNSIEHERMRFSQMDEKQLETRLNKITDRQKLKNFIRLSDEHNYSHLFNAAINRYQDLFGTPLPQYLLIKNNDDMMGMSIGSPEEISKALDKASNLINSLKKQKALVPSGSAGKPG